MALSDTAYGGRRRAALPEVPDPVWGGGEWNATTDPQHQRDLDWFTDPGPNGAGAYFSRINQSQHDLSQPKGSSRYWEYPAAIIGGAAALGGSAATGAGEAAGGFGGAAGTSEAGLGSALFGPGEAGAGAGSAAGIGGGSTGAIVGEVGAGGGTAGGAGLNMGGGATASGGTGAGSAASFGANQTVTSGAGTAMSRILDGTASTADWLSVGGNLGSTWLGIAGSRNQANAYRDLQNQYIAMGAPSRSRYEASMTPGFDPMSIPGYSGAVDTASKGILARLAASGGNPWGNPGGLIEANKQIISGTALPAIQNYQNQNAATGGYGAFNTAAPAAANSAIGARGGVYNAVGSGLAGLLNPQPSLLDTLRGLGVQGLS